VHYQGSAGPAGHAIPSAILRKISVVEGFLLFLTSILVSQISTL